MENAEAAKKGTDSVFNSDLKYFSSNQEGLNVLDKKNLRWPLETQDGVNLKKNQHLGT